ncbi:MAG: tRNA pseudouridine(55) synthase TruB [Candidatus Cryptobacteroides sp.]
MTRFLLSSGLSRNIEDYPEGIVLPIDKPYRWTSADVIRKVKYMAVKHFNKKNLKVGHAGTLDPLATGILLVCIGPATRRAEALQASPKQYLAGVSFGATTASYDLEKDIDREYPDCCPKESELLSVLPRFVGEQMQVAPLFSAKSVDGVRAYETARKLYRQGRLEEGSDLLQANLVNIYSLELESYAPRHFVAVEQPEGRSARINVADLSGRSFPTAMLRVDCSKGTYIRALARDLGEALGGGAFLSSLRRTKNGGFGIEDAISLDEAVALLDF